MITSFNTPKGRQAKRMAFYSKQKKANSLQHKIRLGRMVLRDIRRLAQDAFSLQRPH